MKPIDLQFSYKKQIGFTNQQKKAFKTLENYNVNVNQFIRDAISEKIKREWKMIKEEKHRIKLPF